MNVGRVIAGSLVAAVSLGIGTWSVLAFLEDARTFREAQMFSPGQGAAPNVVLEGRVTDDTPLLIDDFVQATREVWVGGGRGSGASWYPQEEYHQALTVDVDGTRVRVVSPRPARTGVHIVEHPLPESTERARLVGIKRGSVILAQGAFVPGETPFLQAEWIEAESRKEYEELEMPSLRAQIAFCGGMFIVGIAIVVMGLRSR